jgi:hypothetical protein
VKNVSKAFVYENALYVATTNPRTGEQETLRRIPSPSAKKQIRGFDESRGFEPGTYRFTAPEGSQTLVAALARSKRRPKRHHTGDGTIKRAMKARLNGRLSYAFAY